MEDKTSVTARSERPKMDSYGKKAVFAAGVGYGLDGFDLLILSFALSPIIAEFGFSDTTAGSLTTLTLLGAVIGGLLFGALSDRFGRVRVLTWSVVFFAVFTGMAAFAQGYVDLAIYRFLAGVGIGGEFGCGMALASEAVPAKLRARATSLVATGFQLGVLAASLLSAPIISLVGWRGLFAVGIVPAIVAIVFRKRLHESPKYLEQQASQGKQASPFELFKGLFSTKYFVRISIAMIILCAVQNFGYYSIITWLPRYLESELGLSLTNSSLWTAVTIAGMLVGLFTFGQLADKWGRRYTFWTFQIGAGVSMLVYSQLTDPTVLLIGGFFMGVFANGALGGYGALLAELYPTWMRGTAQNGIYNIGRAIGGLAPVTVAWISSNHGFAFALLILPCIYVLAFFTMLAVPDKTGEALE
ncbi:benzoate transport [Brevibacterium sanguinis]|uniref:Benzoate transport n=2 Tax=Brevibacterium TaxID=1696 RepID=A0A366ICJ9_9MICO|nr:MULTISPECIES: MFS transporter [Brevibacterium]RBP61510.1 benzoate transport [Brevibacterium sanguinis]RBP68604.1 benzoate transport [Brevibacterium celere]